MQCFLSGRHVCSVRSCRKSTAAVAVLVRSQLCCPGEPLRGRRVGSHRSLPRRCPGNGSALKWAKSLVQCRGAVTGTAALFGNGCPRNPTPPPPPRDVHPAGLQRTLHSPSGPPPIHRPTRGTAEAGDFSQNASLSLSLSLFPSKNYRIGYRTRCIGVAWFRSRGEGRFVVQKHGTLVGCFKFTPVAF